MSTKQNSPWENFSLCLPHPYLTRYSTTSVPKPQNSGSNSAWILTKNPSSSKVEPPFELHSSSISFSLLFNGQSSTELPLSNNSQHARARRSPSISITWTSAEVPSLAQIWLLVYAFFTIYHDEEQIRLNLVGKDTQVIKEELVAVGLAIPHPIPINATSSDDTWQRLAKEEVLLLRSAFWQGAGSPFGTRSAWLPLPSLSSSRKPIYEFPVIPTTNTLTTRFPSYPVHALHPIRPAKPQPGSIFYSRYIPHLNEHFSMVALDYKNQDHLQLFHTWQNDPRVAAGWNETGTIDHHRKYLQDLHSDPHVFTILAYFDSTPFAYFEVYWAAEDHMGAHFSSPSLWDRGRHSLVGDTRFRGPHRAHAWWSSLMHYMFLDDVRTEAVVGEPKESNRRVLELDVEHGFHVERVVDLGHKRSAWVRCGRERFFGLCTVGKPYAGRRLTDEKL